MDNSTRILDLPVDAQQQGVQITTNEQLANNSSEQPNHLALDQNTINQIISGLQKASASGATQLPSRDIPTTTNNLTQDIQVKQGYIPPPHLAQHQEKYIPEYQQHDNYNYNSNNNSNNNSNSLDDLYNEIQVPLLLTILYFLFQLPIFRKLLFTYFPILFSKDGNININGYFFTSVLFGILYYLIHKVNAHFGNF